MMTEVVAALIWEGERFLICQRPAHKARGLLWEFVGGKVEPGETPEQALVRECREELDVTVSVGEPFMDVVHLSGPYGPSDSVPRRPCRRRPQVAGTQRSTVGHPRRDPQLHLLSR